MELEQKWNVNPRGLGAWRAVGMGGRKSGDSFCPPPPPITHLQPSPFEALLVAFDFSIWNTA